MTKFNLNPDDKQKYHQITIMEALEDLEKFGGGE